MHFHYSNLLTIVNALTPNFKVGDTIPTNNPSLVWYLLLLNAPLENNTIFPKRKVLI